ncbi:MAG: NUDIX hydrolase [Chlorobiaceae bacterium]|nr:NUDIX hydrolase [Chlorobiaceae bacterium]NTW74059.1 NUDIX hydrolase [Chlorobiaceae bacterium]
MAKATVTAVIFPENGPPRSVLLTRRNVEPFKDHWCLPGGHIDDGETVIDAVRREVSEETGLRFDPSMFIGWFDEIFPEHRFHAVVLAFSGPGAGALRQQPEEVSEIAWIPLEEALSMPLAFNHNLVLQRYATSITP